MAKRGGFPGGMPGNMANLMKQAQRMQRQMEEKTKELEEKQYHSRYQNVMYVEVQHPQNNLQFLRYQHHLIYLILQS